MTMTQDEKSKFALRSQKAKVELFKLLAEKNIKAASDSDLELPPHEIDLLQRLHADPDVKAWWATKVDDK